MTGLAEPLELLGAAGSPYTRKMIALLRYRRIAYAVYWGSHRTPPQGYPETKVKLLPTFYFRAATGGLEAQVDSTPIIAKLEKDYEGRSVYPHDPVLAFIDALIEDFADEWLTKAMFHYRWSRQLDIANAGHQLIFWHDPTLSDAIAQQQANFISKRQIDRLYVVGSNDVTAQTIEDSYERTLAALDHIVQAQGYVLGHRPSAADFALYGQLTQLAIVDPTPAAVCSAKAPRIRAWVDRLEDLSGLQPNEEQWCSRIQAKETLNPILAEIGRVYVPFLWANARAVMAGQADFECVIDGRVWTQPTFPYQAKCLNCLRARYFELSSQDQAEALSIFAETGCSALFEPIG